MTDDRYKYFRAEAREIVEQLARGALDLEKGGGTSEPIAGLLRLAHTLKGAARVVRLPEIADRVHALEDTLSPLREAVAPLSRSRVDQVLSLVDEIANLVAQTVPPPPGDVPAEDASAAAPALTFRPATDDLDAVLGGVFEAGVRLSALRPGLERLERGRQVATLVADHLTRPRTAAAGQTMTAGSPDKIVALAEDLRAMFGTLERELASNIDQLDRELRHVREAAERLRLAPASAIFLFLERAARDAANALGKRIHFEVSGGDVRVDAVVLNVIQGALLHVVRNAAVHGIEASTHERHAAGKPLEGRITLTVTQRGRMVSFACSDDGRGIDLAAVRRLAERHGASDHLTMDAGQLLRYLFKGGVSTTRSVTDVAGRGVGLDVVREAAERLGGEVSARTAPGTGTTIELVVPLSIASFPTLIVDVMGTTMAIPLDAVRATIRVRREEIVRSGRFESVLFEGEAIPVASVRGAYADAAIVPTPQISLVVLHTRAGTAACAVDRVLTTAEAVMRPLPELAIAAEVVSGTTFDAVGDPQLILDPEVLVTMAQEGTAPSAVTAPPLISILVVDDSLTTRMLEQSILESAGYAVATASSAEEALEKARAGSFALFVVDVEMPGMDGFGFVEQTRADPQLRGTPSILVTSRSAPEDRRRGLDVGAKGYMVKSEFDQGALIERIRALVG